MSDVKATEATWKAEYCDDSGSDEYGRWMIVDSEERLALSVEAGAHLAATAPELYRALLAVEWSASGGNECPTCFGITEQGHEGGCSIAAALKKARGE